MAEYIGCKRCDSTNCKGCNINTLSKMLDSGKFDCIMDEHHSINPTADVEEVVRCLDCVYWQDNNGGYPHEDCRWGKDETPDADDYCSFGEKMDGKGEGE